jgi:hypothetical protein
LYDNPLLAVLEYIQNAVDALDQLNESDPRHNPPVDVTIDGRDRSLRIADSGPGIEAAQADAVLHGLGSRRKDSSNARGFRGIGRLSGLAYCDTLRFITRANGERLISMSSWDCRRLAAIISDKHEIGTPSSILRRVVTFEQREATIEDPPHYFVVEMRGIRNALNPLLNVPAVRAYVAQVAPVPFDRPNFHFAQLIDDELGERLAHYRAYAIRVNGQQVFKPYSDSVRSHMGQAPIESVRFLSLKDEENTFAHGWVGEWEMSGTIDPSTLVDGVRLRCGNMLVGGGELLGGLFRERRFNSYLAGEIHISDHRLLPNSRRDNLEDGQLRDEFLACFVREVGAPYSRLIRQRSDARGFARRQEDTARLVELGRLVTTSGFLVDGQKERLLRQLVALRDRTQASGERADLERLVNQLAKSRHALEVEDGRLVSILGDNLGTYRTIFNTVYQEITDKGEAVRVLDRLLRVLLGSLT